MLFDDFISVHLYLLFYIDTAEALLGVGISNGRSPISDKESNKCRILRNLFEKSFPDMVESFSQVVN